MLKKAGAYPRFQGRTSHTKGRMVSMQNMAYRNAVTLYKVSRGRELLSLVCNT